MNHFENTSCQKHSDFPNRNVKEANDNIQIRQYVNCEYPLKSMNKMQKLARMRTPHFVCGVGENLGRGVIMNVLGHC